MHKDIAKKNECEGPKKEDFQKIKIHLKEFIQSKSLSNFSMATFYFFRLL